MMEVTPVSEHDKDVLSSVLILLFGVYVTYESFVMPSRGEFTESPGLFPFLVGCCTIVLGILYLARSIRRGGGFRLNGIGQACGDFWKEPGTKKTLSSVLFIGLYIFVGIPLLGFYISSGIFMLILFLLYVKRWKPWLSALISVVIVILYYLTFHTLFMLQFK